ncbi:MAG: alpha/beta hydrolase [Sphingobacteriales bacterium]
MRKIILPLVLGINTCFAQTFPNSNTDGKYYVVNGAKIWTVSVGKGDPLFIIPGRPGNSHITYRAFDSLYQNCTVVYFDPFGTGKSDTAKTIQEYSLKRSIEDIEGLRIAMGFSTINLLGHSFGSVVAQGYAIKYPTHISHLILSLPFHSGEMIQQSNTNREIEIYFPEIWDSIMKLRQQGRLSNDSLYEAIRGKVPFSFMFRYNPEGLSKTANIPYPNKNNNQLDLQMSGPDGDFNTIGDLSSFDYRKDLRNLIIPILVMAGRYDKLAPPKWTIQYKQFCPRCEFVFFEKSGHTIFREEPEKTFALIKKFLEK